MFFQMLTDKFQFKFKDRNAASEILGEILKQRIKSPEDQRNALVLGIPRAGVVTADIVAKKLSTAHFNIIIPRKLAHPDNQEMAIGSIMEDGTCYINEKLIKEFEISSRYLEKEKVEQVKEIKRRKKLYGKERELDFDSFVDNRIVILSDDGAATGATLIAATTWIMKLKYTPKRLIIAIPIAPRYTVDLLKEKCEAEVETVITPSASSFHSLEQYHKNFETVNDDAVITIMKKRGLSQ
jgi:putative phosphoribosyl transferase